jgi:hypothetical protein
MMLEFLLPPEINTSEVRRQKKLIQIFHSLNCFGEVLSLGLMWKAFLQQIDRCFKLKLTQTHTTKSTILLIAKESNLLVYY